MASLANHMRAHVVRQYLQSPLRYRLTVTEGAAYILARNAYFAVCCRANESLAVQTNLISSLDTQFQATVYAQLYA